MTWAKTGSLRGRTSRRARESLGSPGSPKTSGEAQKQNNRSSGAYGTELQSSRGFSCGSASLDFSCEGENSAAGGVRKHEIIQVASHLLDNLLATEKKPAEGVEYYNGIFTLASVKDEWADRKQLAIQYVTLRPLQLPDVSKVIVWLKVPAVRESFVPRFPENQSELRKYFTHPTREYFGVYYNDQLVGIVGGENVDLTAGKLEMKKLVGESGLQGKGIGQLD